MRWDEWRGKPSGEPTLWIRNLLTWRGRKINLHKIVDVDEQACFHSHPSWGIRVILRGGYVEQFPNGKTKVWRPGMIGVMRPELSHRISALLNGPSYSLFFRGRKITQIVLSGWGWRHYFPGMTLLPNTRAEQRKEP